MIKSALTALALIHYAIKTTLADKIGWMVLIAMAVAAIAFAIVDISGWDWFAASQIILLGAFSIAGTSLVYIAGGGRHEKAHEDGPPQGPQQHAGDL